LRRAFVDGLLYRTQGSTLARMTREQSADESSLVRTDLDLQTLQDFRKEMRIWLQAWVDAVAAGRLEVTRQQPSGDSTLLAEITYALQRQLSDRPDWLAPPIPGKR
jgi:hypothetical protein